MEKVKTYKYKNHKIRIFRDLDPTRPDDFEDGECFLVYDHKQFTVKSVDFEPREIYNHLRARHRLNELAELRRNSEDDDFINETFEKAEAIQDDLNTLFDEYHIWVVYAYIHSGIALSLGNNTYPFNVPFDVSSTGYVLINKAEFEEEDKAKAAAESVVKMWNQYLAGEVYGYEIHKDGKELDSAWGFYGNDFKESDLLPQAKSLIDTYVNEISKNTKQGNVTT